MNEENKTDETSYEETKPYFKATLEQMIAAGHSILEFIEFTVEKFGDAIIPHVKRFLTEVRNGQIAIKGLSDSAKSMIFGVQTSPEQREQMIREAAYYRAERRGFSGGSDEEDWQAAQEEIDNLLAKEAGLVEKGRKTIVSVAENIEQELTNLKDVITEWLHTRQSG